MMPTDIMPTRALVVERKRTEAAIHVARLTRDIDAATAAGDADRVAQLVEERDEIITIWIQIDRRLAEAKREAVERAAEREAVVARVRELDPALAEHMAQRIGQRLTAHRARQDARWRRVLRAGAPPKRASAATPIVIARLAPRRRRRARRPAAARAPAGSDGDGPGDPPGPRGEGVRP